MPGYNYFAYALTQYKRLFALKQMMRMYEGAKTLFNNSKIAFNTLDRWFAQPMSRRKFMGIDKMRVPTIQQANAPNNPVMNRRQFISSLFKQE